MYRLKKSKAYSHGNYIRPNYISVWFEAYWQAAKLGVSLSEFISHALYVFMTGKEPAGWTGNFKLVGKLLKTVEGKYAQRKGIAEIRSKYQAQRTRIRQEKAAKNVPRTKEHKVQGPK